MYIKLWKNNDSLASSSVTNKTYLISDAANADIKHNIEMDDNVNMFIKKLVIYMSKYLKVQENEIYIWTERKIVPSLYFYINFINNVFQNEKRVDTVYFIKCINNYFVNLNSSISYSSLTLDKQDAIKLLLKYYKSLDTILEPLLFKYTNNGFFEYINYNPLINQENTDISTFSISSFSS